MLAGASSFFVVVLFVFTSSFLADRNLWYRKVLSETDVPPLASDVVVLVFTRTAPVSSLKTGNIPKAKAASQNLIVVYIETLTSGRSFF